MLARPSHYLWGESREERKDFSVLLQVTSPY